nr:hypothetical protein [Tanacetum cinerariifolium]
MAISVISVYLDSSEGSVRTHIGRVILFGTIPTTILDTTLVITLPTAHTDTTVTPIEIPIVLPTVPPLLDHTLASLNYSPASPDYSPASPDYSPASDIDDTPDTPPSPTHDHSSLDLPSTSAGPSHKLCRSPMTPEPVLSPVSEALSLVRADLIPLPKRFKDSGYLADVEVDPKETSLRDDVMVRGINARVVVESIDREESEMGTRGPVKGRVKRVTLPMMLEDTPEPAQEERAIECMYETLGSLVQRFHDHTEATIVHRIQVIEGVQMKQGQRIVGVESAVTALTKRIVELERDNKRLRGTESVESQKVDRLQRRMSRM